MKFLTPTQHKRRNEATGLVLFFLGCFLWLSLLSYQAQDPSWNTASNLVHPLNLTGYPGSYAADVLLQVFGLAAFALPILAFLLAWKWIRSDAVEAPAAKLIGSLAFLLSASAALSVSPWHLFGGTILAGGSVGLLAADYLVSSLNPTGAILMDVAVLVVSLYLVSSFSVEKFLGSLAPVARLLARIGGRWSAWLEKRKQRSEEKRAARREKVRDAQAHEDLARRLAVATPGSIQGTVRCRLWTRSPSRNP